MTESPTIQFVSPRPSVEIHLPGGQVISGPRGAAIVEFLNILPDHETDPIVGAVVNDQLRELTYKLQMDANVRLVTMGDADGMRFYRRSLTFLLESAFHELHPDAFLTVDHSVSSGGYYCQVSDHAPLSSEELTELEERMQQIVVEDLPFTRNEVPIQEAIAYFEALGYTDKVRLLRHRKKEYLVLYKLGEHRDYHHGYMVPSSSYLKWFKLIPTGEGFTLRFPRRHNPTELLPLPDYPTLLSTFHQYGAWLQRMGIDSVGALNDAIAEGRHREIVLISEALHEQRIAEIARQIADHADQLRVILIAGPSSSGKTTFSKRLAIQLLARGISPYPIEMDNYFVNRDLTPRDENGEYDFESIKALNTAKLGKDLQALSTWQTVQLPRYDFKSGKSEPGQIIQLHPGQIVILEGIHGLNPELIPDIPTDKTFRIYISALTQLNLDRHNRVSTTDTRLIRRIVRDARERGYSAQDTIGRWESVRRGEKRYIFPYQENANVMFNSALVYELSALKPFAEPLLRQVPFGTPEHIEAKRLLTFLEWFLPMDDSLVPNNSILKEFIGDSGLKDFHIWQNH
ncbi:MAG TPA: nucleoside kinase [Chloroflexi bacterium]|nr:nucleoside kinase [Chloroflexota bacterium]HBY08676.1 nucleoside kinase [Chloroflexota bacterium]